MAQISDREFDKLVIENSLLEKKYPNLILKNGPNAIVGGKLKNKFKKIKHKSPMLSLANAFNLEDIEEFDQRIKKYLNIRAKLSLFFKIFRRAQVMLSLRHKNILKINIF